MTQVYRAYVYSPDDDGMTRCFIGEIEGVNINTNIPELKDTPIEFYGDTREELLRGMVTFLKGTGKTGVLRVVN
jgi:hypothetical protein